MHSSIEEKLDQLKACVHCGMCLPACPTYLTTGNEGHSPRGRLYLIRDHIESSLRGAEGDEAIHKPQHHLKTHDDNEAINYLDACLECRACETACPSGVEYASILDYARHETELSNYSQGFTAAVRRIVYKYLLSNRFLLNLTRISLRVLNLSQIPQLLKSIIPTLKLSPGLEQPYIKLKTNYTYQSKHPQALTVSLPLGCVMDTLYNHVHWDTIKVLNVLGCNVYIPETQCCGALASHSGEHSIGAEQTQTTLNTLKVKPYPVIFNSAGCGAHLKQATLNGSPRLFEARNDGHSHCEDSNNVTNVTLLRSKPRVQNELLRFASNDMKIQDFIELIQNDLTKLATKLKNSEPIRVTYHPACHLNHAQGIRTEYQELLKLIPNLELIPLEEADVCCGSAGFYNLIQPQMADAIGNRKAGNIKKSKADILVTANPGCISQIQAHLPEQEILHPISLIARYLHD